MRNQSINQLLFHSLRTIFLLYLAINNIKLDNFLPLYLCARAFKKHPYLTSMEMINNHGIDTRQNYFDIVFVKIPIRGIMTLAWEPLV